jgi:hypothetical protein
LILKARRGGPILLLVVIALPAMGRVFLGANMARPDLFLHTLNLLRGGEAQAELSERLDELIQACADTGKPGTLALTLKVKPNGKSGQYVLTDQIAAKTPQYPRADTLLFEDADGNLTREDPRQKKLELKSAPLPELRSKAQ